MAIFCQKYYVAEVLLSSLSKVRQATTSNNILLLSSQSAISGLLHLQIRFASYRRTTRFFVAEVVEWNQVGAKLILKAVLIVLRSCSKTIIFSLHSNVL